MNQSGQALFIDRDGVINVDHEYVCRIEDFTFIDGVFEACRRFRAAGWRLVVITNQAGIAYGLYTETDFHNLNHWMMERFRAAGVPLDAVYHCPHHPRGQVPEYSRVCPCRKPAPGMILRARDELGLDLGASVLVGDKETDIEAGINAGVGTTILVRSGKPVDESGTRADHVVDSLRDVPALVFGGSGPQSA